MLFSLSIVLVVATTTAWQLSHVTNSIYSRVKTSTRQLEVNSHEYSPKNSVFTNDITKNFKKLLVASVISTSFSMDSVQAAVIPLETAIVNLEQSTNRGDAVQSLADLYESAGENTMIARSEYKYVSMLTTIGVILTVVLSLLLSLPLASEKYLRLFYLFSVCRS